MRYGEFGDWARNERDGASRHRELCQQNEPSADYAFVYK